MRPQSVKAIEHDIAWLNVGWIIELSPLVVAQELLYKVDIYVRSPGRKHQSHAIIRTCIGAQACKRM